MFSKTTSLTEFILNEEHALPHATGNFTLLLTQIAYTGQIIASHIKKAGLVDILGKTGSINDYADEVIKLDQYSHDLFIDTLSASKQVYAIGSEELTDFHYVQKDAGDYVVFLDPLDGSSNLDANITVGSIFSIYKKSDSLLQPGRKQVAAGYILYGTSIMFVYSSGSGVNGFTLDPSIGSFILSHPNIVVPESGDIYSVNEAYSGQFDSSTRNYLDTIKKGSATLKLRYAGSMVADVHRTLLKGGIFLSPLDSSHPEGKLRLMLEVNPLSFLVEQAKGKTTSRGQNPLDIMPKTLQDTAPIALGSRIMVEEYLSEKL